MDYFRDKIDVAVIGAGHAGIEAAMASARLGCKTAIFTVNMDSVGNLPCNPSIGGTAKGHLVREIDALGGVMAKAADKNTLQSRMLNLGKGPAVHSLRAQIDRRKYGEYMKHLLENTENLALYQAEIVSLERDGENWCIKTRLGATYQTKAVVIATGTYLGGRVYIGEVSYESGPDGLFPASFLTKSLVDLGMPIRRFKTGTPARVLRRSIDFSELEEQKGDEKIVPFSFSTDPSEVKNTVSCHISWTNDETKRVILENLHRSPLYSGKISGVGPRYCPSIEDKIVKFPDKPRHQLFIEPCGENTEEMYLQGMSSSLPEEVQIEFYKTIKGLENLQVMRNAYAIEYDCVDPTALAPTLEVKALPGIYGAGQFNGSSGYEEAACQGLIAGINAALKIKGRKQLVLSRSSSYIGTLIDDLCTKGCADPYRMMTSRSEYRLILRQDNADERLMPIGREIGLVSDFEWEAFQTRMAQKKAEIERANTTYLSPSDELNEILVSRETTPVSTGVCLAELLKRPTLDYGALTKVDVTRPDLPDDILERVEVELKYEGYIKRQQAQINENLRLEGVKMPEDIDYNTISGISREAAEKLTKIRPESLGQAGRISGISPADISVLIIWLEKERREKQGENL